MAYNVVQSCPLTFLDWSSRASSTCSRDTYHCVEDEESRIVEVCAVPLWIKAGHCPVYNTMGKDMNSRVCSGNLCPKEEYRSDAVYKYHGCRQFGLSASMTTSTSTLANIPMSDTSDNSIITGSVTSVFVVILLVILGIILWRKKILFACQACVFGRVQTTSTKDVCKKNTGDEKEPLIESEPDYTALEKITPQELNADTGFISDYQDYLETCGNMLAVFAKLGSGKRTLAAQIAIRLAKKDPKLKIKIVREGEDLSEDLASMQSTVLVIHNPVKTWFTSKHTDEIMSCLSKICMNAKKKNYYVISIFHCNDLESLKRLFRNYESLLEKLCSKRIQIRTTKQKLTEMANNTGLDISNLTYQIDGASIGDPLKLTLYLRNRVFQNQNYLSNPTMFIYEKLKSLEESPEIHDQFAFKVMIFVVLHDGEIAKSELDDISQHSLFANLNDKMNLKGSINKCVEQLRDLFIEETVGGRSYRVLHDVITRCTFLAAMEKYRTLLFTECNPTLIFDCIRVKSVLQRCKYVKLGYDFRDINIGFPTDIYPEIAKLFFQRTEIRNVLQNSKFYEEIRFLDEWRRLN